MAEHVVILQHGIWGSPAELVNIRDALWKASPDLRIVISDVNTGKTRDGVAAGGDRLAALIRREVPNSGSRLSIVAHSLGGVYSRYALRVLERDGWFDAAGVQPTFFITLASPHLGIQEADAWLLTAISVGGLFVVKTASDLALHTNLMEELVDDVALASLGRFQDRVVYGNLINDKNVRPCTSLIVAEAPDLSDPQPRVPLQLHQVELTGTENFTAFPDKYQGAVQRILNKLLTLQWERYAVYMPKHYKEGDAHIQISNHALKDKNNNGAEVVAHLAGFFGRISTVPEGELQSQLHMPAMVQYHGYAAVGIFQSSSDWDIVKGMGEQQMVCFKEKHFKQNTYVIVKLEGDIAQWFDGWTPNNGWHKEFVQQKALDDLQCEVTGSYEQALTRGDSRLIREQDLIEQQDEFARL